MCTVAAQAIDTAITSMRPMVSKTHRKRNIKAYLSAQVLFESPTSRCFVELDSVTWAMALVTCR
jgi:hypothetical protein